MVKFENVTKVYGKSHKAVDDLNLELRDGEIFGFLGPNGAGKTTTIKMMLGVTPPTEGRISYGNLEIGKDSLEIKRQIGFVPDNPDIYLRLKGIEYLNFMADIYKVSSSNRASIIENLATVFEMKDALNDKIQSYSHGMRQKIVLMGALIHNPNYWILDEPMTGLDPKSSFVLKEMMRKHADAGNVVFFSTHVLEVAEKICDRVGIINKGKMLFVGTFKELREKLGENSSLEQLFLEMTENEK